MLPVSELFKTDLGASDVHEDLVQKFEKTSTVNMVPSSDPQLFCGNIIPKDFLIAPISQKPCVYYQLSCSELMKKEGNYFGYSEFWETRFVETKAVDFFITDPETPGTILSVPCSYASIRFHSSKSSEVHIGGGRIQYTQDISRGRYFNSKDRVLCYQNGGLISSIENVPNPLHTIIKNHKCKIEIVKGMFQRMKFVEKAIFIDDTIGMLGILSDTSNDPSMILPVDTTTLDESYFISHKWTPTDVSKWFEMVGKPVYVGYDIPSRLPNYR